MIGRLGLFARINLVLGITLVLSACQSLGLSGNKTDSELLESLQPAVLNIDISTLRQVSLKDVIENYSALLPMLEDPTLQMKVLHRLADLKLEKGEYLMAEQAVDELDVAVSAYSGLLAQYPASAKNDQVLYQLSKTYDLKGMRTEHLATLDRIVSEFPTSKYFVEVQFRRGEILFSDAFYEEAQDAFESVIIHGESDYLTNALYMKGWSQFKQNSYQPALVSYTQVLDTLLEEEARTEELSSLEVEQKYPTLIEDLLRVMGLSFSYLGGEKSVGDLFDLVGRKQYEVLVYDRYSKLLYSKEQYGGAIDLYRHFISRHANSLWSPIYQVRIIDTLIQAGFRSELYAEKSRFVQDYGLGSAYWDFYAKGDNGVSSSALDYPKSQLEILVPELADLHYVKAQQALKNGRRNQSNIEFKNASHFNRAFVETFPAHDKTANRFFLLAEGDLQLRRWRSAISAFEQAGYQFEQYENAAESAYASILAYEAYETAVAVKSSTEPDEKSTALELLVKLQEKRQASRLRFVSSHKRDKRALDVLFIATTFSFEQKQFQEAVELSQRLLDWPSSFDLAPSASQQSLLEASLIKAHSLYSLQDYVLAEPAYKQVLTMISTEDKRRLALTENLAACVFKQAEQLLSDGKKGLAIDEFLRVGLVAPTSTLRASAEYDAANYLLELKLWPKLIDVLTSFRQRYPKHKLVDTLPAKLALAYRETEQWELAAKELRLMYELAKDEQEKKDTLYIVAELYDKAENHLQAILNYRKYANTYPEPVEAYMEAANRLAQLYILTDKPLKRRFWLSKQMKAVDKVGKSADDRMRYLAAAAASVLANDAFIQYKRIKLTLPLNEAMVRKTKALEKAMKAFQKTASYGISAYSTEAGYRMADIYNQLSVDLMESDRPNGLNELELEQYEILLEEQTFPFEDSAIDIHEQNASRSWNGIYDDWVKRSFDSLRKLLPGRYAKDELLMEVAHDIN